MAKKLWGSRFPKKTNTLADRFTSSISFDQRLAKYDCLGSVAHARMLVRQGIIPRKDGQKIIRGLNAILKSLASGKFKFDPQAEDIHSNIQDTLLKQIGPAAYKLHTARSRNDQIAVDERLYLRDVTGRVDRGLREIQRALLDPADEVIALIQEPRSEKEYETPAPVEAAAPQVVGEAAPAAGSAEPKAE